MNNIKNIHKNYHLYDKKIKIETQNHDRGKVIYIIRTITFFNNNPNKKEISIFR